MESDGVIERYAIGGAVGATFHLEPVSTLDVDIFVALRTEAGSRSSAHSPFSITSPRAAAAWRANTSSSLAGRSSFCLRPVRSWRRLLPQPSPSPWEEVSTKGGLRAGLRDLRNWKVVEAARGLGDEAARTLSNDPLKRFRKGWPKTGVRRQNKSADPLGSRKGSGATGMGGTARAWLRERPFAAVCGGSLRPE